MFQLWDHSSQCVFAFTDVFTLFNTRKNPPEANLAQMCLSVLLPCPLELITPSCSRCHGASNETSQGTQQLGNLWVTDGTAAENYFLEEDTITGVVSEKI